MAIELDQDAERLEAITKEYNSGTPEPASDSLPWLLAYTKRLQDALTDGGADWTCLDGKANSSYPFEAAVAEVESVIKDAGHTIVNRGIRGSMVGGTIMARLAHVHGLISLKDPKQPLMQCPNCGHWEDDHDGMGMMAHTTDAYPKGCGWCSHPNRTDGDCDICGDSE